jgi:hypothetical protein
MAFTNSRHLTERGSITESVVSRTLDRVVRPLAWKHGGRLIGWSPIGREGWTAPVTAAPSRVRD